ncbi:hypothetical protein VNO78_34005 [Psophocarpus tetragonolobus]|uniref:Senescence-associated carboxylesterase 101 n=1 Tax=Psophocarpus tetragonolobus TaxID=3891 RepID=A0AAN9P202_PSOTE
MTQSALFSSGFELASFVKSSVLLRKSWDVIKSLHAGIVSNVGEGLSWKVHKDPNSGLTIIAFEVVQDSSNLHENLVSSNALGEKIFNHFKFLCTKKALDFSIDGTAISLLDKNYDQLHQLKSEIESYHRLIVTGHGLGGPIASLFTLSLYDRNDEKKNSPEKKKDDKKKPLLCITFGSPLVGDKKFQEAISRSSTWSSSFLHVVSYEDPVSKRLNRETTGYMPFGTFLFCSDTNSTCFENPDSVLELLMNLINDQNHGSHPVDYGNIVDYLYRKAICKDFTPREKDLSNSNSLHASIYLQLEALGLTTDMPQQQPQNTDINALVTTLEKLEHKLVLQKRPKIDPSKKLNIMKINMAQLESYKMNSKIRNIGYYDCYKNMNMPSDSDAVLYHKNLTKYWEEMVEQVDIKPQKEGAAFRTRWLYGGTNYRRMVEPLAIAQYYNEGGKDYMTDQSRSKHFVQLEEWLKEEAEKATSESNSADKSNVKPNSKSEKKKNVESILTFDSCFWAHVEEALLSCKLLEDVQSSVTQKEEATRELLKFEKYVYGLLMKYEVSSEIFLKQSSYMIWWYWYEAIKGTSYNSALKDFMSNSNNYNVQYVEGTYNFSPQAY